MDERKLCTTEIVQTGHTFYISLWLALQQHEHETICNCKETCVNIRYENSIHSSENVFQTVLMSIPIFIFRCLMASPLGMKPATMIRVSSAKVLITSPSRVSQRVARRPRL